MLVTDGAEHPVPKNWHFSFRQIADAFVAGDFQLQHHSIHTVRPIDVSTAREIAENISAYGDTLVPLSEETWDRSIYRWMDGYWQFLVDLSTATETVSDLTLHATLRREADSCLEVDAVYVP